MDVDSLRRRDPAQQRQQRQRVPRSRFAEHEVERGILLRVAAEVHEAQGPAKGH